MAPKWSSHPRTSERARSSPTSTRESWSRRDTTLACSASGDVNLAPEYAASMLEFLNNGAGEATGDAGQTTDLLNGYLEEMGLVALTPSDAVDTNAFVITSDTSESLGIESLSDLAEKGA